MTAPNPRKQRIGWNTLDRVFTEANNTWVVHYSCESFYDRENGQSPRITSIALRKLDSAQTRSFSIHQLAEIKKIPFGEIKSRYDILEKTMLDNYFNHLSSHKGAKYLHWNMRDINYGFSTIEHRYKVLGCDPFLVEDDNKCDLSRLFIDIFGTGYISHPRLEGLMKKNSIEPLDFMTGKQEAQAFEDQNFVGLHQSTLRKATVIADFATRAHNRNFKTNTIWWKMHGGRLRSVVEWIADNKIVVFIVMICSILLGIIPLFYLK